LRGLPNVADAHMAATFAYRRSGQVAKALEHHLTAQDLDPLNANNGAPIMTIIGLRRFPEGLRQAELRARLFPAQATGAYAMRARIESRMKNNDLAPLRQALDAHGERMQAYHRHSLRAEIAVAEGRYLDAIAEMAKVSEQSPIDRAIREAVLYRAAGDEARASTVLAEAKRLTAQGKVNVDWRHEHRALVHSLLGEHDEALRAADEARRLTPEARDAMNGPYTSFVRSVVLVRAGRHDEGYAEARRLLRVPFGSPVDIFMPDPLRLLLKDDPGFDELLNRPPRL
jgi:tetratricopeptide (TPR) repeat protein